MNTPPEDMRDKDFPDHVRGTAVTLHVKANKPPEDPRDKDFRDHVRGTAVTFYVKVNKPPEDPRDKDFPDHVRGTAVTLYVKANKLAEAQTHIGELKALFAPHGYDMKQLSLKIDEDTNR